MLSINRSVLFLSQVVSAPSSNPQQGVLAKSHPPGFHVQPGSRERSPIRAASPDRPHSSDCKHMFRFEGHFEAPNNPNLSESLLQAEPHQPAGPTHAQVEQTKDMHLDASVTPAESPQQTQSMEHAGVSCGQTTVRQKQASQRPESEFRRSHRPEFYDTKYKRYVLR